MPSVRLFLLTAGLAGQACLAPAETAASRPLAPPSAPAGPTLFTTLSAADAGLRVENHYRDPRMWGTLYREFTLGAIGTGLAAGDFDGDGWVDLFVVSKTESSRLFRNRGNFTFEDVTAAAGLEAPPGVWSQGATFADINNDGWLDLYVCRFDAPNLLYVNQGDGTFREEAAARGLALVSASGMAAFADYDRDGWLDVYIQTNAYQLEARPTGQPDHLYRNRGDGTFEEVTATAGIRGPTQGHSATWWDYDEDGWPDLYVANDFKDPDTLYRNNHDGTFTNVLSWVVPRTPHSSMGADLGDVNNDGHTDLLVADMAATSRIKDHRGMAKVRAGLLEPGAEPRAAQQYMLNTLFLGTGTGRVQEAAQLAGLAATDWTWTVRLADLDNDGWLDAYFTNGMVRELHQADLVAQAMANESNAERIRLMRASPRLDEANLAFRNDGDLTFRNVSAAWGLDHTGVSFAGLLVDLDQDGDLDLVFSNYESGVTLCRNDSTTGARLMLELRGSRSNRFGIGARVEVVSGPLRQVQDLVLARGYLASAEPVLHFGLGPHQQADRITIQWPSGRRQVLEDLPAGHRHIITEPADDHAPPPTPAPPAPRFSEVSREYNLSLASPEPDYNEFRRQPLLPFRLNPLGPAAAFGDLDGDGRDDLVIGGTMGERARLLSNLGGGQYLLYGSSLFADATRTPDAMVLLFEANGDGRPDLLLTQGGVSRPPGDPAYAPRLFLNLGDGRFAPAPAGVLPDLRLSAGPAVAADFDRDGDLDLFLGGRGVPGSYPSPADSFLLRNDEGRFADVTADWAPMLRQVGCVTAALASDVDGDGWIDLVLTREWNHVLFLRNPGGDPWVDRSVEAGFAAAGSGLWRSIATGDFNRDGRPDYVAGNLGLNTRYRATREQPALLFRGGWGGRPQIIEAAHAPEDRRLYPLAARDQLAALAPALGRRFPTAAAYAAAPLEEVVGPEWLAQAERYEATELASGIFLSRADGTFRFRPLPRLAQLAPIDGLSVDELDGDGRDDVLFVGNAHGPTAPVGRFDGGLGGVLRGDGAGGFAFVPPARSGWVVPFDGQALARSDIDEDGWPDYLVTRSNDTTLVFAGRGPSTTRSTAVMLAGPPSNPTGVGARVTVTFGDGRRQQADITAGSGYLSQSTAAAFFVYPADDPPRLVTVRWPDGRHSEHPWHDTPRLLLHAP